MDLVRTQDPRYEELRSIHNGMIGKRPSVIAQCAAPADVIEALALARHESYEVAVRAGGHSVAGMCLNDAGLVIDVRPMKSIDVDPDGRRVRVGAGVTWGEFDRSTQAHGLATTGGHVLEHGCRRLDARRWLGMGRAGLRACLRQPHLRRPGHCRRARGHRQRGFELRSVLGPPRGWG